MVSDVLLGVGVGERIWYRGKCKNYYLEEGLSILGNNTFKFAYLSFVLSHQTNRTIQYRDQNTDMGKNILWYFVFCQTKIDLQSKLDQSIRKSKCAHYYMSHTYIKLGPYFVSNICTHENFPSHLLENFACNTSFVKVQK